MSREFHSALEWNCHHCWHEMMNLKSICKADKSSGRYNTHDKSPTHSFNPFLSHPSAPAGVHLGWSLLLPFSPAAHFPTSCRDGIVKWENSSPLESRRQQQQQKDSTMTLEFVVVGRMRSKRESELWIVLKKREKAAAAKKSIFILSFEVFQPSRSELNLQKSSSSTRSAVLMLFAMKTTTNRFWALERRQHEMKHIHTRSSQRAGEQNNR